MDLNPGMSCSMGKKFPACETPYGNFITDRNIVSGIYGVKILVFGAGSISAFATLYLHFSFDDKYLLNKILMLC